MEKNNKKQMDDQSWSVLHENSRDDAYTVPSKKLYPFQWNWDSCFTALGWAQADEKRAWQEIRTLYNSQWDRGLIPHIIFHKESQSYFPGPELWRANRTPETSGITQPPVGAMAVKKLYEGNKDVELSKQYINGLFEGMFKFHYWFHEERDPKHTGLVATYHPWETGRDNSAEWDEPLSRVPVEGIKPYHRRDTDLVDPEQRPSDDEYDCYVALVKICREYDYDQIDLYDVIPFRIADVGTNAILLRSNHDLLWLMQEFDYDAEKQETVKGWIALQEKAMERMWNEQTQSYHSIDLLTGEFLPQVTSASFLPLFAGIVSKERAEILANRIAEWSEIVSYMVPSLDPKDAAFDSKRYWKGPVWPIMNFMISLGFKNYGYVDIAERIRQDTARLILEQGLEEYYDPLDGECLGGVGFTWTAAMWLYWCGK